MALISKEGLESLKKALISLEQEEVAALESVTFARSLGDLSENSELDAAKNELERIQDKITVIKSDITTAVIFDINTASKDIIGFGAKVILEDDNGTEFVYYIVHSTESDITVRKISFSSPLAQAMMGKKTGDSFTFYPPAGEKTYTVLSIDYSHWN